MQIIRVFHMQPSTFTAMCARRARRGCCAASGSARCSPCFPQSSWQTPRKLDPILNAPCACHPCCLQQGCTKHGRVVAKSCAPGPGARERTVARRGGAGVAAHDLLGAGAGAGGRGRGPGADDQPSGRRTFPSVLNARSPGMKPPRNSRLFVCRADARRAAPSVPGNDKPTGLDHAGLDAGGARLRRARLGLVRAGRPPELPCTKLSVEFPNFGTTASSRESVDATDG